MNFPLNKPKPGEKNGVGLATPNFVVFFCFLFSIISIIFDTLLGIFYNFRKKKQKLLTDGLHCEFLIFCYGTYKFLNIRG